MSRNGRIGIFVLLVASFWGSGLWQMSDNRRTATEDEIEELESEGECEARYAKAWMKTGYEGRAAQGRLTRSEVQGIRGLCLREQRIAEKQAQRAARD